MTSTTGGARDIAQAYFDSGNYSRAEEVLRSALANEPDNPDLLVAYAQARLGLDDYQGAAWAAHSALAKAPHSEHAKRVYAFALSGQGRSADALQVAWKSVTEHPDVHLAHYAYANLLLSAGQPQQALTAINEALRLNPAAPDTWVLRGDIYRALNWLGPAEADYREALRLQPDNAAALNNLAVNLLQRGNARSAIDGFVGAGQLDPGVGELARYNISAALMKWLRLSNTCVIFLFVAAVVVMALHDEGRPTVIPRIIAGLITVGFVAVLGWIVRRVPRPVLRAVLRQRKMLVVRMLFLVFAVLAGLGISLIGPNVVTSTLAGLLLPGVILMTLIRWFTRH
ncbi:tetratricopeptide repeat protein [Mycolicibacterium goodii]|uniref:pro-sigmaK processing inhibitor BofA family protein n=1 Tax=Mycolicibacterium goodii TaxID=134601 RepID=UPI001F042AB7|nr:pro-sigmaK processing inhibitor BofA family protein [Mycolicibacterium goodii]ULN49394.1 tetratricopeptide repeat protein [Mycolicibacterium goodii]